MDWHDNVISVSTLTERFEELRDEREALAEAVSDTQADAERPAEWSYTHENLAAVKELVEWDIEYGEEYKILGEALEEMRGYGGNYKWEGNYYPSSLIARSHFPQYAKECARGLHGNAIDNADWPFNYIDWEKAADALEDDYNSIEIDGTEYLYYD
jgi:hypothetical protein